MQKKWLEGCINLIFWLSSAWLIISSFSIEAQEIEIINGVENIQISRNEGLMLQLSLLVIISMAMFYLNLWNLKKLLSGKARLSILLSSAFIFMAAFLLYLGLRGVSVFSLELYPAISLIIGILFFYFSLSTAYGLGKVWLASDKRNQELLFAKKSAELSLLRAQLQPHFLFNVLNNLLAMVDQQTNPKLAKSIGKLSSLLRYVVYEAKHEQVSLSKEIEFIRDFAALYQDRFEEGELEFRLEVKGDSEAIFVEPGIFIPFIENAFKYGILPEKQSLISITFYLEKAGQILFQISNPIHPEIHNPNEGGNGLPAIKKRLELVYPDAHILEIDRSNDYRVELSLSYD
ncbi:MAG: histidine kinase [Bacteroidia bacterium]|nr:histidine kinase [Bacteroidia bacterium]